MDFNWDTNRVVVIWEEHDFVFDQTYADMLGVPRVIDMTPDTGVLRHFERRLRRYNRCAAKRELASMIQEEVA